MILLCHRYFLPDTAPYGVLLKQIAEGIHGDGHSVRVFAGPPTYRLLDRVAAPRRETLPSGIVVRRARLIPEHRFRSVAKAINAILFACSMAAHILRHRPKLVMCSTQPPVVGALLALLATRCIRGRFVYHLMDVHPEIVMPKRGWKRVVFSFLRRIDAFTCRSADRVVVLSQDMAQSIRARPGCANTEPAEIPNYSFQRDGVPSTAHAPAWDWKPGALRLAFAGNLGRFQAIEALVQGVALAANHRPVHLILMGDGALASELQRRAAGDLTDCLTILPFQPFAIAATLMAEADLCIVSLGKDVYRYAFPSKLMSYFAEGAAVLAIIEPESQLAQWVRDQRVGVTCEATPESIRQSIENAAIEKAAIEKAAIEKGAIERATSHGDSLATMRTRSRQLWNQRFAPQVIDQQWQTLVAATLPSGSGRHHSTQSSQEQPIEASHYA
jgi:colanic acid biosynthesis glycosyl transferase WcaI